MARRGHGSHDMNDDEMDREGDTRNDDRDLVVIVVGQRWSKVGDGSW